MTQPLHVVILAAGEGKRMKSARPKVLQPIAGRPMLAHVVDAARALRPAGIHVVHGHGGEQVRAAFAGQADLAWAEHEASQTDKPARRFRDFRWSTLDSWSHRRRVVGKAEWTRGEANPRFVVTSLKPTEADA